MPSPHPFVCIRLPRIASFALLLPILLILEWFLALLPVIAPSAALAFSEADILRVPQDLRPFAEQAGAERRLLSAEEQAERNRRSEKLFFGPWTQTRPSLDARRFREQFLRKPRGFHLAEPWTEAEWQALHTLINAQAYPSPKGPAIATRHADVRTMPTEAPLFLEATSEPAVDFFDFFQVASLAMGTPVYVSHASRDGHWLYVEYPLLSGWVRADALALVPRAFAREYMRGPFAAVVADNVPLTTAKGTLLGQTHIGAMFPWADPAEQKSLLVPTRNPDGTARLEQVTPPEGSVLPKPLPLTPAMLARLGNAMLGEPYAWGGAQENRDCSLATRDLFLPFGLWLPRNSRDQAPATKKNTLTSLSPKARKAHILRNAKPFMTLLGFPGHVGLYVGQHEGEPVMLHNILGLRTSNPDTLYRHLIGKCILSTLEPGLDLPELLLDETLLERLRSVRHLD